MNHPGQDVLVRRQTDQPDLQRQIPSEIEAMVGKALQLLGQHGLAVVLFNSRQSRCASLKLSADRISCITRPARIGKRVRSTSWRFTIALAPAQGRPRSARHLDAMQTEYCSWKTP